MPAAASIRQHFSEAVLSARTGVPVPITKHGKVVAALVSAEDFAFLEKLENKALLKKANKSIRTAKNGWTFVRDARDLI